MRTTQEMPASGIFTINLRMKLSRPDLLAKVIGPDIIEIQERTTRDSLSQFNVLENGTHFHHNAKKSFIKYLVHLFRSSPQILRRMRSRAVPDRHLFHDGKNLFLQII